MLSFGRRSVLPIALEGALKLKEICCIQFEGYLAEIIATPECHETILPIVATIPVQLFSYNIAMEHGCDVDKPRNLAKSVKVE